MNKREKERYKLLRERIYGLFEMNRLLDKRIDLLFKMQSLHRRIIHLNFDIARKNLFLMVFSFVVLLLIIIMVKVI